MHEAWWENHISHVALLTMEPRASEANLIAFSSRVQLSKQKAFSQIDYWKRRVYGIGNRKTFMWLCCRVVDMPELDADKWETPEKALQDNSLCNFIQAKLQLGKIIAFRAIVTEIIPAWTCEMRAIKFSRFREHEKLWNIFSRFLNYYCIVKIEVCRVFERKTKWNLVGAAKQTRMNNILTFE